MKCVNQDCEGRESPPSVGIIILNWNNYEDTSTCLESARDIRYPNYKIFVIDNGSSDNSGRRIAEEYGWCEVIFNEENRGFAGGVNKGINVALEHGVDYVLLMQNDMTVDPSFLNSLVTTAEKHQRSLVGGLIYYGGGNEIWSAGGSIVSWKASVKQWTEPRADSPYETEFLTGALLLIPRRFIEQNGALSEDYFYMHEDLELSVRAQRNGWKLMVDPGAEVYHEVSSSAGRKSPFSYYHNTRNRLRFANDELSVYQRLVFSVFFVLTRFALFVRWAIQRDIDRSEAILLAVYDHVRNHELRRPREFGLIGDDNE